MDGSRHTPHHHAAGAPAWAQRKKKKYLIKIKTAAREVNVSLHKNKYAVVHCSLELKQQRSRARRWVEQRFEMRQRDRYSSYKESALGLCTAGSGLAALRYGRWSSVALMPSSTEWLYSNLLKQFCPSNGMVIVVWAITKNLSIIVWFSLC
jgi:hypothetical protein